MLSDQSLSKTWGHRTNVSLFTGTSSTHPKPPTFGIWGQKKSCSGEKRETILIYVPWGSSGKKHKKPTKNNQRKSPSPNSRLPSPTQCAFKLRVSPRSSMNLPTSFTSSAPGSPMRGAQSHSRTGRVMKEPGVGNVALKITGTNSMVIFHHCSLVAIIPEVSFLVPGRHSLLHLKLLRKDIHILTMDCVTEVPSENNRSAFIFKNKYSGQTSMRAACIWRQNLSQYL